MGCQYSNEELIKMYRETGDEFLISDLYKQTENLLKNIVYRTLLKYEFLEIEWGKEDLVGELNISWNSAFINYNLDSNILFSTYLSRCCYRRIINIIRDCKTRIKHKSKYKIINCDDTLDSEISSEDLFNNLTCKVTKREHINSENQSNLLMDLSRMKNLDIINEDEFQLIYEYYFKLNTFNELGESYGLSRQTINNRVKTALLKIQRYYTLNKYTYELKSNSQKIECNSIKPENVVGVCKSGGTSGKWRAYISVNGKVIRLGSYEKFNEAVRARLMAELIYYTKEKYQTHLHEKYSLFLNEVV